MNENTAPAGELTDGQIDLRAFPKPDCPNIYGGVYSAAAVRAIIAADRALRASPTAHEAQRQAGQEPVAAVNGAARNDIEWVPGRIPPEGTLLYTTPQPAPLVGDECAVHNLAAKLRAIRANPQDNVFIYRAADVLDAMCAEIKQSAEGDVAMPILTAEMRSRLNGYLSDHWYGCAQDVWNNIFATNPSPTVGDDDAASSVNETNAALAAQYFEVLKKLAAYEKNGVTCQTFQHFVDVPCAECNAVVGHAAGDVDMPVISYLRATPEGQPIMSEDCVCEDPVYPSDQDGSDADTVSMPMVKQSDAQAALAAKNTEIERLSNVSITQSQIIDRLQRTNADYSMNMREASTEIIELRKRVKSPTQAALAAMTAERDALRKDAARWTVWRDSLSEQSQDEESTPELFKLLLLGDGGAYGPKTPQQIEAETDSAIAAMTKEPK